MLTLHSVVFRLAQRQCECASGPRRQLQVGSAAMCFVEEDHAFAEVVCEGCSY